MLPQVARLLNHEPVSFYTDSPEANEVASLPIYAYREASGRVSTLQDVFERDLPENSVLVLHQRGVVMKEDYCGIMGTASMGSYFKQAMQGPKIIAAVMDVDSPGGAVNGTLEFTNALYESSKPVIGFANGLAASAGYEMLTGCGEIYASSDTAMVGSVGVMMRLRDYSEQLKKYGVKDIVVTAETSPDKNADVAAALAGDVGPLQRDFLNPLHAAFQATVRRTRTEISDSYLTGKVYLAKAAMEGDMIDGIMSFEDTVERALEMGMLINKSTKSKIHSYV